MRCGFQPAGHAADSTVLGLNQPGNMVAGFCLVTCVRCGLPIAQRQIWQESAQVMRQRCRQLRRLPRRRCRESSDCGLYSPSTLDSETIAFPGNVCIGNDIAICSEQHSIKMPARNLLCAFVVKVCSTPELHPAAVAVPMYNPLQILQTACRNLVLSIDRIPGGGHS